MTTLTCHYCSYNFNSNTICDECKRFIKGNVDYMNSKKYKTRERKKWYQITYQRTKTIDRYFVKKNKKTEKNSIKK